MSKFKILSLDGGGVRGYLTAIILSNIERALNQNNKEFVPIGKYFDLIAGTSTGAIIAGFLAIGKCANEIKDIYEKNIKEIFSDEMKRFKFNIFKSQYKKDNLTKMANEYFQNKTFSKDDLITNY